MQKLIRVTALALVLTAALSVSGAGAGEHRLNDQPTPPDVRFGPLFNAVQAAKLFPDQKTFADAIPNGDPTAILADWQMQKTQHNFDLKRFVTTNFTLPQASQAWVPPPGQSLREHINSLWPVLSRTTREVDPYDSLLPLPQPYVVPGGRFREVYYWDSYFTLLGLAESGRWESVQNMVDNFASELNTYGHIPNGNRSYYLSRSQPPFFSLMVELLAQHGGDEIWRRYLPALQTEYAYWMADADRLAPGSASRRVVKLPDGTVLNRYWDDRDVPRTESWMDDIATANATPQRNRPELYRDLRAGAASGWDFSSRWFSDPQQLGSIRTTKIIPVDLNALLYHQEQALARASGLNGDRAAQQRYREAAERRKAAINRVLWDPRAGWYADYDWERQALRQQLTAATLFPLWLQVASADRADRTADAVGKQLLKSGGLLTTTLHSGQQWDAPNGWAPLQWVAVEGLERYHQPALARDIAMRFLNNVQQTWEKEHKLVEKYVVDGGGGGGGGEYPLQDGFGWTNGVTLKLLDKYCPPDTTCNNVSDLHAAAQ
ncbi:alpha,alpha-trehalase TreA [Pantoea sp. 1.19]|uniref:alpha,alpha-trehalase TreA n=1 Tax=Pantoea sp. 1.19 TaxID=1925589 RepID=UPI000948B287|nr:alpha,alpha-trehalase TreA [Pantoea sp. 1.19]